MSLTEEDKQWIRTELEPIETALRRWLKRHPNVHFHFTPTYSSWLNQVECWFSVLSRQALRGASFTSPRPLRQAIDAFVAVYNQQAAPFDLNGGRPLCSHPLQNLSTPI